MANQITDGDVYLEDQATKQDTHMNQSTVTLTLDHQKREIGANQEHSQSGASSNLARVQGNLGPYDDYKETKPPSTKVRETDQAQTPESKEFRIEQHEIVANIQLSN